MIFFQTMFILSDLCNPMFQPYKAVKITTLYIKKDTIQNMLLSFIFIVSKIEHNKDNPSSNSVSENWFRNNKRKTINIYVKFSIKQFTLPVHMTTHYCKDNKIQIKKKITSSWVNRK